ncbi:hypothetical protein B0T26DRAFT_740826 [Lasiosphaeria miniovina]|uniref:AMP-dependent synthetase/ligase domain-containing protein n=1 Tax=Lasiosphaeria miniovina TaxID=1954250 RepID=A0AA40AKA1_9PEZI|nr:uncharacterized protein B0T26DRAFT_740826 [Lasiosphaeria miniovina]KAK0717414.1 hypothetical protein B0T26DRAFT_740826 [Lasiosphaeria miniovina]
MTKKSELIVITLSGMDVMACELTNNVYSPNKKLNPTVYPCCRRVRLPECAHTYAETYQKVLRYGAWLRTHHGNSDTFVFLWFAIWAVSAKPAFINYHLNGAQLAHCSRAATASLAILDPRLEARLNDDVRQQVPDMKFVVFTPECEPEALRTEPVRFPDSVRTEDSYTAMAILIYTSGTTGLPKPAIVSWGKIYVAAMLSGNGTGTKTSDVFVPSQCTIIQYVGETCRYLTVSPPDIDPVSGENLDKEHRVRVAMGNGLRPDVWDRFKKRFGAIGTWNLSRNSFGKGAIGWYRLLSKTILDIRTATVRLDHETEILWRNPQTGFCQRVKAGEAGGFIVMLPEDDVSKRFQGCYGNPEASNSKVMYGDGDGLVYFSDRIGDTFRWNSENVSTSEVAQALGLHPALPHHDGRAGCVAVFSLRVHKAHQISSYTGSLFPIELVLARIIGHERQEFEWQIGAGPGWEMPVSERWWD